MRVIDEHRERQLIAALLPVGAHRRATVLGAGRAWECEVEAKVESGASGYRFARDEPAVRIAAAALGRAGHEPSFVRSGGGADANVFNERGLQCVNLANAMVDIHTPDERIA